MLTRYTPINSARPNVTNVAISTCCGRDQAALRHAQRPEPLGGVGAAAEVEDVVGEVRADLDQQRGEQRRRRAPAG